MDIKISIIIISVIISLGGCDQGRQSPGNNSVINTNITMKVNPVIVLKHTGTKTNNVISIKEITNLYNELSYKFKIAIWRDEIRQQEALNGRIQSKEVKKWSKYINDLYAEYSNNWDQISDYDDKFYVAQRYFKDKMVDYINSEKPKFVRQAIESLCRDLERNGNSEDKLSYYNEGIFVLSSRVDNNPSFELCENLGLLYSMKSEYYEEYKNYEEQLQAVQNAVDIISKTEDGRLISVYNQCLAAAYENTNPYEKEKVIRALEAAEAAWASIENPSRKEEVDAYFQIDFIRKCIKSVERGGRYFIVGGN